MLILYVILVLCTVAVVGVAVIVYRHVRRHIEAAHAKTERFGPASARTEVTSTVITKTGA